MASLTSASVTARKIVKYSLGIITFIVLARLTFLSGVNLYEKFFPDPPPKPTVKFGKLPSLLFEEDESADGLNYILETIDGTLPTFAEQADVYLMPQPLSGIRAVDTAREVAASLGFDKDGRELVETVYLFSKNLSPSTLSMNIVTGVFSISYDLNSTPQIFDQIPPTPETATSQVKGLLRGGNLLKDLDTGPVKHQFLRIESGELVKAISLSEANVIKINLFRREYGQGERKLPSVTQDSEESNVWFMLTGSNNSAQIILGEYHLFPIDTEKTSTYPVKTSQQAWEDLKNGKAFIVNRGNNEDGKITIRNIYLAYYDPGQYTPFYQPVAVFEGDNGFVAYVPAVTSEFYGE